MHAAARELGITPLEIEAYMLGEATVPWEVAERMRVFEG
jgi:hypothetical protein